jgi:hypothetical protein
MNGEIGVDSEPSKGSAFHVIIPLQPAESNTITKDQEPIRQIKLLMIDDDPLQLQLTKAMLAHQNIILTTSLHPLEITPTVKE